MKRGDEMEADGSIVIESKLDNAQAEKDLDRLAKKIENIEREISGKQAEKSRWVQSAEELGVQLDSAKANPQIPKLAQGAVIPPNREFLAVLGDQKSGTNIEAPLSTIEQALRNVLAEQGNILFRIPLTSKATWKHILTGRTAYIPGLRQSAMI